MRILEISVQMLELKCFGLKPNRNDALPRFRDFDMLVLKHVAPRVVIG